MRRRCFCRPDNSSARSDTAYERQSWRFVERHLPSLSRRAATRASGERRGKSGRRLVRAALYWLLWNQRAGAIADTRLRVEDMRVDALVTALGRSGDGAAARLGAAPVAAAPADTPHDRHMKALEARGGPHGKRLRKKDRTLLLEWQSQRDARAAATAAKAERARALAATASSGVLPWLELGGGARRPKVARHFTWDDIRDEDAELAARMWRLAKGYGYARAPGEVADAT